VYEANDRKEEAAQLRKELESGQGSPMDPKKGTSSLKGKRET